MARAIDELRPRLVVAENVRGLLSAAAPSEVEPCPWCVGDGPTVDLRALGVVLADLADLGYDAQWVGLRAADVGACHGRFRVFLVAHPQGWWPGRQPLREATSHTESRSDPESPLTLLPTPVAADGSGSGRHNSEGHADTLPGTVRLLPTPMCEPDTANGHARNLGKEARLLPTPAVNDMGAGKTVESWDDWTGRMKAEHGNGNGHGKSLSIEAQRLLPTPRASDGEKGGPNQRGSSGDLMLPSAVQRFGDYAPAIARWETVIGGPAPDPTEISTKWIQDRKRRLYGPHKDLVGMRPSLRRFLLPERRLSPRFVEWMMGLPAGWVTDVPGLTRNEALKALGNGVAPQQAAAALRHMLGQQAAA
jgi:DNA (cytosine-5)-methyltransferase 1